MTELKNPEILIFLSRNRVLFFEPKSGFTKELDIPNTIMKDLEIVDANGFANLIGSFVDNEKLNSGKVVIVVSESISFIKEIAFSDGNKKGIIVQDFTDTIPLEFPEVKVFRTSKLYKVVGVNPKYYQVLTEVMVSKGFPVVGIIPGGVIPEVGPADGLTIETAQKILENYDNVKSQNFMDAGAEVEVASQPIITTGKPKGNTIYVLIGVFVIAAIALVALILLRR